MSLTKWLLTAGCASALTVLHSWPLLLALEKPVVPDVSKYKVVEKPTTRLVAGSAPVTAPAKPADFSKTLRIEPAVSGLIAGTAPATIPVSALEPEQPDRRARQGEVAQDSRGCPGRRGEVGQAGPALPHDGPARQAILLNQRPTCENRVVLVRHRGEHHQQRLRARLGKRPAGADRHDRLRQRAHDHADPPRQHRDLSLQLRRAPSSTSCPGSTSRRST